MPRLPVSLSLAVGLAVFGAADASAELVLLSSGRHLSVTASRVDGDAIVLTLRSGGEMTFPRSYVAQIRADEVPYPTPVSAAEASSGPMTAAPDARSGVPFGTMIEAMAARHGVDPRLVKAVVQVESAYRPDARSPKGAMGLMQLMPETARRYALRNPYDPESNLDAGVRHLRSLLDRFDLSLALAAYNAGEGAVRRFGGIPPYRETRDYVSRILRLLDAVV